MSNRHNISHAHLARMLAVTIVLALIAISIVTAVLDRQANTVNEPTPSPDKPQLTATLIETTRLHHHSDYDTRPRFDPGEYVLSSGTAEFMLTNATNVKLIGPTTLQMYSAEKIALAHGVMLVETIDAVSMRVFVGEDDHIQVEGKFGITAHDGVVELHLFDGRADAAIADAVYPIESGTAIRITDGDVHPIPLAIDQTFHSDGAIDSTAN